MTTKTPTPASQRTVTGAPGTLPPGTRFTAGASENTFNPPALTSPLINGVDQVNPPANLSGLDLLEPLAGTWINFLPPPILGIPTLSYCLMPLPQAATSDNTSGYILKNFTYYEEMTFSPIHGTAPNRGGDGTQVANVLFYEQRVYFGSGPASNSLVHAENGSWLLLTDRVQELGPYGNGQQDGIGNQTLPNSTPPSQPFSLCKQISVPHGNSVLALGAGSKILGPPTIVPAVNGIPDVPGLDTTPYGIQGVGNPFPSLNENCNIILQDALTAPDVLPPIGQSIILEVDSANGDGGVTNIGFEQSHANVTRYYTNIWLLQAEDESTFNYLMYSQTMLMDIPINGQTVSCPHITVNILTRAS